ncbi:MAG: hypothetical protein ACFFD4_30610, partial [Candidatus Odinarchaeota archaeon]
MAGLKGMPMARGLGQVMFNYLPEATLDYDRGSCICKVAEVRIDQEAASRIDRNRILEDIRSYVSKWEGNSELKKEATFKSSLFAFGEPDEILFNIYPLVFECRKCRAAFSFRNEAQFLKDPKNYRCKWCGGRLGQIYHVLVHRCGEMKQLWVPKCDNPIHKGTQTRVMLDYRGSQKAMDFRWKCMDCGNAIKRPIYRKCERCSEAGEKDKSMMRPIPHRANAAYYTHHITRVNVSREDVQELQYNPDKERILVNAYLEGNFRTEDLLSGISGGKQAPSISEQMERKAAGMPDGPEKDKLLEMIKTMTALEGQNKGLDKKESFRLSPSAIEELFDYVKLRGTCNIKSLDVLRSETERKRPGRGRLIDSILRDQSSMGISEISLIKDFPVVTAVFGYTRESAEPEMKIGDRTIRTRFRHFPTFRMSRKKLQDKIPIFTRVSETEGLLIRVDPVRILEWLKIGFPKMASSLPPDNKQAKTWLLRNVGDVDRFVTGEGMTEITKVVFGMVHTLSHIFVRSAASLAGVDRNGFGEYLFPRLGTFVIYNSNTEFNLGGITTLFEEELQLLLQNVRYDPSVKDCLYDPVCKEQLNSSCHACTHLGEMACGFFNRGMRRDYIFGTKGYWSI